MNKIIYNVVIAFAAILMAGCEHEVNDSKIVVNSHFVNTSKRLPADAYVSWVNNSENGLTKAKTVSDLEYKLGYLPAECMACIELQDETYTAAKFKKVMENYTNMTYFNFRITVPDGQGELLKYQLRSSFQYDERIKYLAFGMQKDLFIVQGADTLYPGLYHFERVYDVAPYATIMLAFDNKKFVKKNEFTLVYNDQLFKKGFIKYNYQPNQLIDLPNLSGI